MQYKPSTHSRRTAQLPTTPPPESFAYSLLHSQQRAPRLSHAGAMSTECSVTVVYTPLQARLAERAHPQTYGYTVGNKGHPTQSRSTQWAERRCVALYRGNHQPPCPCISRFRPGDKQQKGAKPARPGHRPQREHRTTCGATTRAHAPLMATGDTRAGQLHRCCTHPQCAAQPRLASAARLHSRMGQACRAVAASGQQHTFQVDGRRCHSQGYIQTAQV